MSLFALPTPVSADEKPKLEFYGYLSHQVIFDSYRSLDSRDGELYFYPLRANIDPDGNDINKKPRLNMIEVQTRFGTRISGPQILGAEVSGVLEADFFGTHQNYVRMFRLRHAYVNFKWQQHQLLVGNTFHPAFVLECFPGLIGFAAGVPFHPLNRAPQIRYTWLPTSKLNMSLSLLTHGYHKSVGPADAQRNSGVPDTQFRLQYGDGKMQTFGIVAGYKFLTPRDQTLAGYSTRETIGSYNIQAYLKHTFPALSVKAEVVYGQNMSSFVMIGGYGARAENGSIDLSGDYSYTNLTTMSAWTDLETRGNAFKAGLFGGYTANLGADHDYIPLGYARNDDLHYVFRISPRLTYQVSNLTFGFEWSVVGAVYGTAWDSRHRVLESEDPVLNNHVILSTKYTF